MATFTRLGENDWPAHPDKYDCDESDRRLVSRRADIEVLGYITDAEADYSFHDFAFIRLDGQWYMLETSGCSCPSPTEEWRITFGPGTAAEMRAWVGSHRDAYGPAASQWDEFVAMFDAAEAA